jgi:hypothetical protein
MRPHRLKVRQGNSIITDEMAEESCTSEGGKIRMRCLVVCFEYSVVRRLLLYLGVELCSLRGAGCG